MAAAASPPRRLLPLFFLVSLLIGVAPSSSSSSEGERLPTKCEVCKFLTTELQAALDKTKRSKEVLELGEVLDSGKRKRKIKYHTSETRLAEAMDNICEQILQYSVHAERPGSLRFAKGTSETMNTLKNLVHKGVKVELGIPFEMWDSPSAEVTDLKMQCEKMLEAHEEVVEDWYFNHQHLNLDTFLCEAQVLKDDERGCLTEVWSGKGDAGLNQEPEVTERPKPSTEGQVKADDSERNQGTGGGEHDPGELCRPPTMLLAISQSLTRAVHILLVLSPGSSPHLPPRLSNLHYSHSPAPYLCSNLPLKKNHSQTQSSLSPNSEH
uniref:Canopy FGF signaling regulator 4 n=1 Tax=Callorhinchus milii TaxID=7868 RepID=A0A4W3J7W8_CALMI